LPGSRKAQRQRDSQGPFDPFSMDKSLNVFSKTESFNTIHYQLKSFAKVVSEHEVLVSISILLLLLLLSILVFMCFYVDYEYMCLYLFIFNFVSCSHLLSPKHWSRWNKQSTKRTNCLS
jgi:hypothetical protein